MSRFQFNDAKGFARSLRSIGRHSEAKQKIEFGEESQCTGALFISWSKKNR